MKNNIKYALLLFLLFVIYSILKNTIFLDTHLLVKKVEPVTVTRDTTNRAYYSQEVGKVMLDAMAKGNCIKVQTKEKVQFEQLAKQAWVDMKGKRAYCSVKLLYVLDMLAQYSEKNNQHFALLSLIRLGSKNHGLVLPDSTILCTAVDINIFDGNEIRFKNPNETDKAEALACLTALIQALPKGNYSIGTPRPKGGGDIDTANDYFLPVTDLSQIGRSQPLENIVDSRALLAIKQVMANNSQAHIDSWYPDAADHIHLSVKN